MRASASRQTSTADAVAALHGVADLANGAAVGSSDDPRHLEEPGVERPASGALASAVVAIERRPHLVRRDRRACRVTTLAVGGTPVVSICCTWSAYVEDVAELAREQLDLARVELEMGERGDRFDLGAGEIRGHGKC